MSTDWQAIELAGYDLETTGTDPFTDRVVQAAVVLDQPGTDPAPTTWVINPGIEIPEAAAEVHGLTTEYVQAHGRDPEPALFEISCTLGRLMGKRIPLVVANAAYDLTMTEVENTRHGLDTLAARVDPLPVGPVIDPMVLDKYVDTFRKSCYRAEGCDPEQKVHECGGCRGSRSYDCGGCGATDRTLSSLAIHYGVELGSSAHDAAADALAAVRVTRRIFELFPKQFSRFTTPGRLHVEQIKWRREQMDSLRSYFDKAGIEHDGCDTAWPIRTQPAPREVQEVIL